MTDDTTPRDDDGQEAPAPDASTTDDAQGTAAAEDTVAAQPAASAAEDGAERLSADDEALLDEASAAAEDDLVAEYRDRAARAEAELVNFRTRVERDRQSNRDAVVAEVLRALIPALDDLARAEAHGDIEEGSSMALVVTKLRGGFDRFGFRQVGAVGEGFDPTIHEAIASFPGDVERDTVLDVVEPGYLIGERLVRPAKVAVQTPKG